MASFDHQGDPGYQVGAPFNHTNIDPVSVIVSPTAARQQRPARAYARTRT